MCRIYLQVSAVLVGLLFACEAAANPSDSYQDRAVKAETLFAGAEDRFAQPSQEWFLETQSAMREEVARVATALDALSPEESQGWKTHLRWGLLEANLHSMNVNLQELELVRRWMFSNRKGIEHSLFADLRVRMDAYLDAVFTFSHNDLQATFREQTALARSQCQAIAADPSDVNAAALGRTLGWLERTGQLEQEVAEARQLLSLPNVQVVVSNRFSQRLLGLFETEVDQTVPVRSTDQSPPSGILQRERMMQVTGSASSIGSTELDVVPNDQEAQLNLIFQGKVTAHCKADAGPAAIHVVTRGPVAAVKPIFVGLSGLRLGETEIDSQVITRVEGVSGRSNFFRRVAQRRADQPEARSHIQTSSHDRTVELLQENLDQRVDEGIAEIRAEIQGVQQSTSGFREVLAPVVREGAVPRLHGLRSTATSIELNVAAQRRNQLGAVVPYSSNSVGGDLQLRIHASMLNNTLETILGGKTLSDEFLMRYAKILQAQLPLPLMVHSRSKRWAITTEKHRPLELRIPEPNRLQLTMRLTAVEFDGKRYEGPATVAINYDLVENDFDELVLMRDGDIQLETDLPSEARAMLSEKLDAFFAPLLDAGGVSIPDGGILGALNGIQPAGFDISNDWIVIGVNIPEEVFNAVIRFRRAQSDGAEEEVPQQPRQACRPMPTRAS